jgi:lysophospholipid acyltransferase (LPLAT)-like uncharacterized protein
VKLRKPWMISLAAMLGAGAVRLWMTTIRSRPDSRGFNTMPWDPALKERYIYVFWHEKLLFIGAVRSAATIKALISQSRDGELISKMLGYYGVGTIRGSSTRGGMEAVDEVLKLEGKSHLIVAPDGPRGPRREVKRGLVYLSAWTGLPIVPLGIGYQKAWHAKSWDRLAVPKLFSTIDLVSGDVIRIPKDVSKSASEDYRREIERSLNFVTELAEDRAAGRVAAAVEGHREAA